MSITFGVPVKKRTKKEPVVEKYPDTAVLTMNAKPTKGGGCKFVLNPKALELLDLDLNTKPCVSIAVTLEGDDYIPRLAVTTGIDVDQYIVRKNSSFSDKKMHEYLTKKLKLDDTVENEFEISFEKVENNVTFNLLTLKTK